MGSLRPRNADQPVHIYLVMRGTLAFVGVPHVEGGLPPFTVSEVQSALHIGAKRRTSNAGTPVEPSKSEVGSEHPGKQALYPYKLFGVLSYLGELVLPKKDLLELRSEFPACSSIWVKVARRKEWHRGQLLDALRIPRNYKKLALHTIQSFYRSQFKGKRGKMSGVQTPMCTLSPASPTLSPQFPPSAVSPRAPGSPNSASQNNFGAQALANALDLQQKRSLSVMSQDGELQKLRGKVEVMDQRMVDIQQTLDVIIEELKASRPT